MTRTCILLIFLASILGFGAHAQEKKILLDGKFMPEVNSSEIVGYRLTKIRPNSLYDQVGLEDNDILISIDEQSYRDSRLFLKKLSEMRNGKVNILKVRRNGVPLEIKVQHQTDNSDQ